VSPDLDQKIGETHAVIPDDPLPSASPIQDRIQQNHRLVNKHIDQSFHDSDLGCSDSPSRAIALLETHEGIMKVPDQRGQARKFLLSDRAADLIKLWVAKEEHVSNSHRFTSFAERVGSQKPKPN